MNMQLSLIQELMFYKYKLGYNTAEATTNICCAKHKGTVDHSTETRWFKNFGGQVNLKPWVLSPFSKPQRQIW